VTRAVVDTSVLVSALIGGAGSSPALVVRACREGRLTLVASSRLVDELTGVLERAKFDRWTGDGRGPAYVAGLVAIAEMHDDAPAPPSVTDDPNDDFLIALATSSTADYVTSVDRHLLAAQTDVVVLTPAQLLERIR
jgi:putative PIN family toxin of toxin-antitoxin system